MNPTSLHPHLEALVDINSRPVSVTTNLTPGVVLCTKQETIILLADPAGAVASSLAAISDVIDSS